MSKTEKTNQQKDLKRAEQVMTALFNIKENERRLKASIAEELKAYSENAKLAEEELLEIASRNRDAFNADGNLVLEDGYVHTATTTSVKQTKKFDLSVFVAERPDLVESKIKLAPIKKLWLDSRSRKELTLLGIDLQTDEVLQVMPRKGILEGS
ncbi:MAG: hypothetical protein HOP30_11185 [Cyclobacteriaceae bacterium]|nr:hypothetical protein [Cyclobacteriaceae bacterium]